jgi:hypothetical protein
MPKRRMLPTVSAVFNDGSILEMVCKPTDKRSAISMFAANGRVNG